VVSYTLAYEKTYEEWCREKALRIRGVLRVFRAKGWRLDLQHLAFVVYRERLWGVSKVKWRPLENRFLDFKPSPFIKNFLGYLVSRLVEGGYLDAEWRVTAVPPLGWLVDVCTWRDP